MSFNPDTDLKPEVLQMWRHGAGLWPALVKTAVALNDADKKYRDVGWLTSVVFYLHHPERRENGTYRQIASGEHAMIEEWKGFQSIIKPMVPASATAAVIEAGLNPVAAFLHMPIRPLVLANDPRHTGKFKLEGQFQVYMKLDPNIPDPQNYEYRQLIRGAARIQDGQSVASGGWAETGAARSLGQAHWRIPGPHVPGHWGGGIGMGAGRGVHETLWKEDGTFDMKPDGSIDYSSIRHYGHRDRASFHRGLERDEYRPMPLDGTEYFLSDVPGLYGLELEKDQRLMVKLEFQGLVEYYDQPFNFPEAKKLSTVRKIYWAYRFDERIMETSPIRSIPMAH